MLPHALIPSLIALVVLGLVVRRSLRSRRVRVDQLWIVPVLLLAATAFAVAQDPPREAAGVLSVALAALMGGAVGWQRGRLTRISLDADTGILSSKATPAAVILILALFAVRYGVRAWIAQTGYKGESLAVATDALMLFGAAMIAVARYEMWLRCKRLIAAGAGRAA